MTIPTPDKSEMLPCPLPWCDESKPVLAQGGFRNATYRVQCETCGCAGPRFYEPNKAIAAWNTRSRPPADQVPDMVERVAVAIYEALFDADNGVDDCGPLISKRHAADAAIAALKASKGTGE